MLGGCHVSVGRLKCVSCSYSVGVILLWVYVMPFQLLYQLLCSPVQSVLVGIIRVSVSGGLRPGKHHRHALGGASGGTEVIAARSSRIGQRYYIGDEDRTLPDYRWIYSAGRLTFHGARCTTGDSLNSPVLKPYE